MRTQDWKRTTVGEAFRVVGGGTPSTSKPEFWKGSIPWITSADIDSFHTVQPRRWITKEAIENSATNLVPAGSIIVVTRVGLGKVAVAPEDLCFSQDSQGLLPVKENIDSKFAVLQLSLRVQSFKQISRGTTINGVTKKQLLDVELLLPPLNEQQRVVAKIEKQFTRLDTGVVSLKRVQIALKRYRASVLKAACDGRLVLTEAELARKENRSYETGEELLERILKERRGNWNGRNPYIEPTSPPSNIMSILPEGWVRASLDQAFIIERGKFSVRPRNDPRYYHGEYPFVQIGDLPREGGNISAHSQTLNELGLGVSKKFATGTGLIAIVGATIANTGILSFDSCAPDSLVAFQSREPVTIRFAELYLRTIKLQLRQSSYASGGQPNINLGTLKPLPIPLPPLAEQRRIVDEVERRLSVVEELDALVSANGQRAARLRQSLLRNAFAL